MNYNNGNYVTGSIYERKYLSGKDPYAAFLNSNQSTTVVSGGGQGKLLILKDSYANCFAQFVIDDYAETHLIDLRFFKDSVSDYIAENGITQVLVLYNIPILPRHRFPDRSPRLARQIKCHMGLPIRQWDIDPVWI